MNVVLRTLKRKLKWWDRLGKKVIGLLFVRHKNALLMKVAPYVTLQMINHVLINGDALRLIMRRSGKVPYLALVWKYRKALMNKNTVLLLPSLRKVKRKQFAARMTGRPMLNRLVLLLDVALK